MKRMYLVSKHRNCLRTIFGLLLLGTIVSCSNRQYDISYEDFIPENLPFGYHSFAFESDSVGYAATILLETADSRLTRTDFSRISKTVDRGRSWVKIADVQGLITEICCSGSDLYYIKSPDYTSFRHKLYHFATDKKTPELLVDTEARKYGLHIVNDSTIVFLESYFRGECDSIFVSKNLGKNWNKLNIPGKFSYEAFVDYDGKYIYLAILKGGERKLLIINIATNEYFSIQIDRLFDIQIEDGLFARHPMHYFYQVRDSTLEFISSLRWQRFGGSYHPKFLAKNEDVVLGASTQYPGKKGRRECIYCSVDNGYHWKILSLRDGRTNGYANTTMTEIPDKKGVCAIYETGDSLHIISVAKRNK